MKGLIVGFVILVAFSICSVLLVDFLKDRTQVKTEGAVNWENIPSCTYCNRSVQPNIEDNTENNEQLHLASLLPENEGKMIFWCEHCKKTYAIQWKQVLKTTP